MMYRIFLFQFSAAQQLSSSAAQQLSSSAAQQLSSSALQHFSTSALQHFSTSALQQLMIMLTHMTTINNNKITTITTITYLAHEKARDLYIPQRRCKMERQGLVAVTGVGRKRRLRRQERLQHMQQIPHASNTRLVWTGQSQDGAVVLPHGARNLSRGVGDASLGLREHSVQ
jgi:hypothetical protein